MVEARNSVDRIWRVLGAILNVEAIDRNRQPSESTRLNTLSMPRSFAQRQYERRQPQQGVDVRRPLTPLEPRIRCGAHSSQLRGLSNGKAMLSPCCLQGFGEQARHDHGHGSQFQMQILSQCRPRARHESSMRCMSHADVLAPVPNPSLCSWRALCVIPAGAAGRGGLCDERQSEGRQVRRSHTRGASLGDRVMKQHSKVAFWAEGWTGGSVGGGCSFSTAAQPSHGVLIPFEQDYRHGRDTLPVLGGVPGVNAACSRSRVGKRERPGSRGPLSLELYGGAPIARPLDPKRFPLT